MSKKNKMVKFNFHGIYKKYIRYIENLSIVKKNHQNKNKNKNNIQILLEKKYLILILFLLNINYWRL